MLKTSQVELMTGNEEFDSLNNEVFLKVNKLLQSSMVGKGHEELGRFFWFLKRYTRKHFSAEEKLQRDFGFPEYSSHKDQHDRFKSEVCLLEKRYAVEGASTVLFVAVIRFMGDWLRDHIIRMDVNAATYLRNFEQE